MDSKLNDKELGQHGEKVAKKYLESKGYRVLETNYRFGKKEVDIIARDGNDVVFIEVKTRVNRIMGEPFEAVGKAKQKSIVLVANAFLEENDLKLSARFDIISIVSNQKYENIQHLQDAFYPM